MTDCLRWRDRRHSWRRRSEGGFDRDDYTVAPLAELDAKAFVVGHHYSGSYPASIHRYGMRRDGQLVGVAVLSGPVQTKVLTNAFPTLTPFTQAVELGRFVLVDDIPANGESWFLARCFEHAADLGVRGVVSFSDPLPRIVDGRTVMPGHVGLIYQASNAAYCGRGTARTLTVLRDGSVLNDRSMQKIRQLERGHEHVERLLVDHGATPRRGAAPAAWLADALAQIGARPVRHRGNHRYLFTIGAARRHTAIGFTPAAYPKTPD